MSEADVEEVLSDPRFAAVAIPTLQLSGVESGPLWDLWSQLMFAKDGEDHKRIRGVVNREFAPTRIERLRPDCVRLAEALCDAISIGEPFDFWSAFAVPYAGRVTCRLVGIPAADAERATLWAFDLARAFFPFMSAARRERAERSAVEILDYMYDLLARRRAEPADDLVSLLASDAVADQLTPDETRALAANMVFAGLEATAKAVCTGAYFLVTHGKVATLAERPVAAATEVLRLAPPAQSVARLAAHVMVCQDVQLRAGQVASANMVAACRDPKRYANPDEFDLDREPGKQLAFGAGGHYCLGAALARLGLSVAFETLGARFPDLELVGGDGNAEWDYEGFAGVVRLDCLVPH